MNRIVIIGGGISGLAAAHRAQRTQSIDTSHAARSLSIDSAERFKPSIATAFYSNAGPDSFISEKPQALALAKRLGLESQIIETNETYRRSFIVRNGRLRAVPEGFQLLAPSRMWPFITSEFSVSRARRAWPRICFCRERARMA